MRRWAMGFHRKSRPLVWSSNAMRVATEAESSPVPTRVTPTSSTAHNDVSELTQCAVLHHSAHCRSQSTMTCWDTLSKNNESADTAKESNLGRRRRHAQDSADPRPRDDRGAHQPSLSVLSDLSWLPLEASLNSFMPWPKPRMSSGILRPPNNSKTTRAMRRSCVGPTAPMMRRFEAKF